MGVALSSSYWFLNTIINYDFDQSLLYFIVNKNYSQSQYK